MQIGMPNANDNKSQICLDFMLQQLKQRPQDQNSASNENPYFVGLSGVQGCGKTTLVSTLAEELSQYYSLPTVVLSLDDLYLSREEQVDLAAQHPNNPLIQHRGQPSTHDIDLGISIFSKLRSRQLVKIPAYDKSAFGGVGDRVPEERWGVVNQNGQPPIRVVIFEGWSVGFRSLKPIDLKRKWDVAVAEAERGDYQGRLGYIRFEDIKFVNDALQKYDRLTDELDALIHLDAEDSMYAYQWRLEQEAALRGSKGSGMTDDQVTSFVGNYYPAYELFADSLRKGSLKGGHKAQLRLVLGRDRSIKQSTHMSQESQCSD